MNAQKVFTRASIIAAGFMLGCATTGFAVPITVDYGLTGGSGDVDNVLYQAGEVGTTINATINTKPGYTALFTSATELAESGGQAHLGASVAGNTFTDLCFSLANGATFTKLQINPDVLDSAGDGTIHFTVTYLMPAGVFNSASYDLDAKGENKFTILAGEGALITEVCWTSSVPIVDANQYRVGGLAPSTSVPDAGTTVALLGLGMFGLGLVSRRFASN